MKRRSFLRTTSSLLGASVLADSQFPTAASVSSAEGGANDETFWTQVRNQFSLGRHRVYMNTAGLGPSPRVVLRAVQEHMAKFEEVCETGHTLDLWDAVKANAAACLGCAPEEVAYTRNTTEGVNIVCNGLPLRAGDEVITSTHEHVGNTMTWLARQRRDGIRMRIFEPSTQSAEENVDRIAELINDRTRALSISHVTTATGQVLPVEKIGELAAERGLYYFVDGAQSAGMMPVDVTAMGCHAYTTSGHKWLLGPKGTGLLYVRRAALDTIAAKWVGAYSGGDYDMATGEFTFVDTAQRYEYGTVPVSLFHGLGVAMDFLLDLGLDRVWQRVHGLGAHLITGLQEAGAEIVSPLNPREHSAIVSFRVPGVERQQVQSYLYKEFRIRTRGIYEGGLEAIRLSPHVYSTGDDIERAIEGVRALVG